MCGKTTISARIHTILRFGYTDTTPRQPRLILLIQLMRLKHGRNALYYISADLKCMPPTNPSGSNGPTNIYFISADPNVYLLWVLMAEGKQSEIQVLGYFSHHLFPFQDH